MSDPKKPFLDLDEHRAVIQGYLVQDAEPINGGYKLLVDTEHYVYPDGSKSNVLTVFVKDKKAVERIEKENNGWSIKRKLVQFACVSINANVLGGDNGAVFLSATKVAVYRMAPKAGGQEQPVAATATATTDEPPF